MNVIIQVILLVALIESAQLRVISLEETTTVEPIDQITSRPPVAKTIDTFVPIADLLNVIAGIQDQLPPLRVKVASFPVSPDLSIKSQTVVESVQETSTTSTAQIEASPVAPITETVQTTLAPIESVPTSILSPVVPEVNTISSVSQLTTLAPTTESSFPTVVNNVVESIVTPIATATIPAIEITPQTIPFEVAAPQQPAVTVSTPTTESSFPTVVNNVVESIVTPIASATIPAIEITPQTIPFEVAAPQQPAVTVSTTADNVVVQTNIVDSIVPVGTSRLFA